MAIVDSFRAREQLLVAECNTQDQMMEYLEESVRDIFEGQLEGDTGCRNSDL